MEKWLSIIGSIASIGSALWAWIEARKSSKAASRAEAARDEIINRRKMVEVSQVHMETKRILRVVSKVGPSSNATQLRGVNCASIAAEVEEYSRFLNEQSTHFTKQFENSAKDLCANLNEAIEALAEAKTPEEKKAAGKNIYYKVNGFMPIVKELADEKKENVAISNA
jgi:hypothetical protein